MKNFKALIYFFNTYVTAFPRILYRSTLSVLMDIKGSQLFLNDILDAQDLRLDDKNIKSVDLTEILNDTGTSIKLEGTYYTKKTSETRDLFELSNLAYLVKMLDPDSIFEIGTYVGRTTRIFSMNSKEKCRIYTLDLPAKLVSHSIGSDYKNTIDERKITQLEGDSKTFDFLPYYNKIDFVWVDACHDYDFVKIDTENALKICKPGGWIAWHDYRVTAWWSGVTKYIREFSKFHNNVMHIKGSTTVIMQKKEN